MPYGLPKNLEGEKNNNWMDSCVVSVLSRGKGINESEAIRMCKTRLIDKKGNQTKANIAIINDLLDLYSEQRREK